MVTHWIQSGAARQSTLSIGRECAAREAAARQFAVEDGQAFPEAVRLSLSAPADLDEVRQGLDVLKDMLVRPATVS